jgi:Tfp pilus assembly PilM family ATPase
MKAIFKKIVTLMRNAFEKIFGLFKKIFTSKLFKSIGSIFKTILSKLLLIPLSLKKLSNYPPLSWIKKIIMPGWRFVSTYLNTALTFSVSLFGKLHLGRIKGAVESLQIFFEPEYITGLNYDSTTISAVRVASSLKGTVIDRTAISPVKTPDKMTWELIEFARREGLEDNTLYTCLPASKATIRQIPIHIENVKKLDKIIKYQMEPYIPFPIDDMVIDFLPSNKSDKVLTAGVENAVLSEHIDNLAQAGLETKTISIDDIALITLFHHASGLDNTVANALIHFHHDKTTLLIIKEGQLMFIRVLAPNKENHDSIKETLNIFTLENPEDTIQQILITGYPNVDNILAEKISSHLDIPTSAWKPFDQLTHNLGKLDEDSQMRLSVPLGLALSGSNSKGKVFDLRKESFAIKSFVALKKHFLFSGYAALVFLVLFTFSTYQKLYIYKKKNAKLQDDMRQVYVQAFPGAKPVKGQELAQMKQKLDEEAKYKVLDSLGDGNNVLSKLMQLTQIFSGVNGLIIHQLSIEGYDIKLYGSGPSFEMVDRLKQALERNNAFHNVKLLDAKMNKREKNVRFNFSLERAR